MRLAARDEVRDWHDEFKGTVLVIILDKIIKTYLSIKQTYRPIYHCMQKNDQFYWWRDMSDQIKVSRHKLVHVKNKLLLVNQSIHV